MYARLWGPERIGLQRMRGTLTVCYERQQH
jgi:hypothetical protein